MGDDEHEDELCKWCGGRKADRMPVTGQCDHLYWPDYLTDVQKRANGYVAKVSTQWVQPRKDECNEEF